MGEIPGVPPNPAPPTPSPASGGRIGWAQVQLVGRDTEVAVLERVLADVRVGGTGTVGLLGEAGIGKSALLEEAAAAAEQAQLLVLLGRAAEHEREVPFALVVDALDEHAGAMHAARVGSAGEELAGVLPSIAPEEPGAAQPAASPADRLRYHRALARLLELLGRERPFALLLDDLHWADQASVEFVLHLLRRPARVPHLLAFALRPVDPADRLVDAARAAGVWEELRLRPLATDAARELLPDALKADAREEMVLEAGGNPLYLHELARLGDPRGEALPSTLLAAVRREVSGLPPASRTLLEGAAVVGDPFDPDVAAAAAGIAPRDALGLLDTLAAADLVRPIGTKREFEFRHPLLRRAIYDEAPPGWRLAAHERAAEALAARGAEPALRAHHVERFARAGDEAAVALLTEAARSTARNSPAAAAHWYEAAVGLLPYGHTERRGDLLAALGLVLGPAGRMEQSRTALEEAMALQPPEAEGPLTIAAVEADVVLGDYERAHRRLLEVLDRAPAELRPILMLQLASVSSFRNSGSETAGWAERALAELGADGPPEARASAEAQIGLGRLVSGSPAGAPLDQARHRLAAIEDSGLVGHLNSVWAVGGVLAEAERYGDALQVLERGARLAETTRQGPLAVRFNVILATCEVPLLRLDSALEHVEEAEDAARLSGLSLELALTLAQRARVLVARAERAEAERAAAESDELLADLPHSAVTAACRAGNALVRFDQDPKRLEAELTAIAGPGLEGVSPQQRVLVEFALVRAAIATDRLEDAGRLVDRLTADAQLLELPASGVRELRARAELRLARNDPDGAARLAREALAAAERRNLPAEALESRLLAARADLVAGEREEGLEALQGVVADAGRAGALSLRDAATRELRLAGARVSARARREAGVAGEDNLTVRESQVAGLVAEGMSNKQVAGALFLSEKTVEHHLSRIYAKLGVRSRTELARRSRRPTPAP
jgi:DNA-binding NarL/FixJ family response regulator